MTDAGPLEAVDTNLWVARGHFTVLRGDIGLRMTVVRGGDGSLWIHSPIPVTPELEAAVRALGTVRWLVGPNKVHHLYLGDWKRAFPEAKLAAAPGLPEKRPDLGFDAVLDDAAPTDWPAEIEFQFVAGSPTMNEVVFFHAPTRTIMLTDLVFHVPAEGPDRARFFHWLVGARGRFGPHRLVRSFLRDRRAVGRGIDRVLAWDFDRAIVTHGEVLDTGAHEALRQAFAYLPR